jgi:DNA-binding NarL/FixJ family response regulator
VLPPVLASPLLSHIADHAADISKAGSIRAVRMTKRERDVIGLIADGMSNQQIARHLHLSIHTVKSHVRNILEKLELHSRLQVAAYAHKAGRPTPESE